MKVSFLFVLLFVVTLMIFGDTLLNMLKVFIKHIIEGVKKKW